MRDDLLPDSGRELGVGSQLPGKVGGLESEVEGTGAGF